MTLFELFIQFGNPSQTYTDELVATFYDQVDDASMFNEAISELDDVKRKTIAELINDRTSRSLSHQMIGELFTNQLRAYPRKYLQNAFDSMEPEIEAYKRAGELAEKADLANDAAAGDAQGSMP